VAEVGRTQPRYGIEKPIPYLARSKSRNALTSARDGDKGETVRHASMRTKQLAEKADLVLRKKCGSEHDGRRSELVSAFILHRVRARRLYIHGCFFRVEPEAVHGDETGTSEVGIAVTAKAPPARRARGVVRSDNAAPGNRD
jgi:hypothetical protein